MTTLHHMTLTVALQVTTNPAHTVPTPDIDSEYLSGLSDSLQATLKAIAKGLEEASDGRIRSIEVEACTQLGEQPIPPQIEMKAFYIQLDDEELGEGETVDGRSQLEAVGKYLAEHPRLTYADIDFIEEV